MKSSKKLILLNIPILTFEKFYEWWNNRITLKWEAEFINGEIKINKNSEDNIFWVRTSFPNKEVYLAPISSKDLKMRKIENAKFKIDYKTTPNEIRKTSSRMMRHDILFKYRKSKQ